MLNVTDDKDISKLNYLVCFGIKLQKFIATNGDLIYPSHFITIFQQLILYSLVLKLFDHLASAGQELIEMFFFHYYQPLCLPYFSCDRHNCYDGVFGRGSMLSHVSHYFDQHWCILTPTCPYVLQKNCNGAFQQKSIGSSKCGYTIMYLQVLGEEMW